MILTFFQIMINLTEGKKVSAGLSQVLVCLLRVCIMIKYRKQLQSYPHPVMRKMLLNFVTNRSYSLSQADILGLVCFFSYHLLKEKPVSALKILV